MIVKKRRQSAHLFPSLSFRLIGKSQLLWRAIVGAVKSVAHHLYRPVNRREILNGRRAADGAEHTPPPAQRQKLVLRGRAVRYPIALGLQF